MTLILSTMCFYMYLLQHFTATLQIATQNASLFSSAEPPTVQPSFSTVIGTGGESLQDKNKRSVLMITFESFLGLDHIVYIYT